jgi:ribosomal protein S18 acetylase RimI-like enzyme
MHTALNSRFEPTLLSRIEDATLNASAPPQQRWIDGWLVRFSPGKAKRARCINAVAHGRLPVHERLAVCAELFAEAKLPLIVRITPFTRPTDLDGILEHQGFRRFDDTRVMVCANFAGDSQEPPSAAEIVAIDAEAFAHRVGGFRDSAAAQRKAHAERLRSSPVPYFAFELRVDGAPVACGQYALEGGLAGLYDVFTAGPARGRGHAGTLCRHLLVRARAQGARHAYLQVEGDNRAARSVYHRLGFADAYAYHYRTADPSAA